MTVSDSEETTRILNEYTRRDALGLSREYRYTNPAFMFHMQEREWALLLMLRKEGIDLSKCSVLEVGCGTGHILQRFLEFGVREATGIDLVGTRIEMGREMYPNVRLDQGNGENLPYPDGSFDLVMQFMCLSSVLDPLMRRQIAAEMWRVVRPGGAILSYDLRSMPIFTRVICGSFRHFFSKGQRPFTSVPLPDPTPTEALSIEELRNLFNTSSFRYRTVSLDFVLTRLAARSRFLATFLSIFPLLRTHYIVVIRKPPLVKS